MDIKSFLKYLSALLLFGSNGIVASLIHLGSFEIVLLGTMIGSLLLIVLFFSGGGRLTFYKHKKQFFFSAFRELQWEQAGCFYTKHMPA